MKYTIKWWATGRKKTAHGGSVKTTEHGEQNVEHIAAALATASTIVESKMNPSEGQQEFDYLESLNPEDNVIKEMTSDMASYKEAMPFNYSKINSAGALSQKQGKKISVCLSNGNFKLNQMTSNFVVPIKQKGEFILVLNFSNGQDKVIPGEYNPASGYGKPFWVNAEVKVQKGEKGVIVSLGVREGTATITKLTDDTICGTFDLKTKADSSMKGAVSGQFNVPLEISK